MSETAPRRTFSLRALFLLMAVCGILLALIAPLRAADEDLSTADIVFAMVAGGLILGGVAVVIGCILTPRRPQIVISFLIGLVLGSLMGPTIAIVHESLWHVEHSTFWDLEEEEPEPLAKKAAHIHPFSLSLIGLGYGGSIVILVLAYFFRQRANPPRAESTQE